MSVSSENPSVLVTIYVAWDILHDTESKDILKRAEFHYRELGVEVPDKKELQALVAEAQELAMQTAYQRDTNALTENEMAKYVRTEAARRWLLKKIEENRRSGEKGGKIYEEAKREVMAKFQWQSAGNVNEESPCRQHFREKREMKKNRQDVACREMTVDELIEGRRKETHPTNNAPTNPPPTNELLTENSMSDAKRSKIKSISGNIFFVGAVISGMLGFFVITSPIIAATSEPWEKSDWIDVLNTAIVAVCIFGVSYLQMYIVFEDKKIKKFCIDKIAKVKQALPIKISIEIGKGDK